MNYVVGTVTGPKPTAKPPATTELSKLKADVAKLMKEGTKLWSASSLHLYDQYHDIDNWIIIVKIF